MNKVVICFLVSTALTVPSMVFASYSSAKTPVMTTPAPVTPQVQHAMDMNKHKDRMAAKQEMKSKKQMAREKAHKKVTSVKSKVHTEKVKK